MLLEHGGCHHVRPQVRWYAVKAAHVDYLHPLCCCLIMILLDGAQDPWYLPCMRQKLRSWFQLLEMAHSAECGLVRRSWTLACMSTMQGA